MSELDFSAGDLVWAKLEGHPVYPGLVCSGQEEGSHIRIRNKATQLHVQFFSTPTTRAWVKVRNVHAFKGRDVPECKSGGMFYSTKKTLWAAVNRAEKAQFQTKQERLKSVANTLSADTEEEDVTDVDDQPLTAIKKRKKSNGTPSPRSKKQKKSESMPCPKSKKQKKSESTPSPQSKKQKKPDSMPSPRSKKQKKPESLDNYIIGKSKIPEHWGSVYVLMDTNDVPEDLKPDGCIKVKEPVTEIKLELPDETEVNDLDSEDEVVDSDADPGWTPDEVLSEVFTDEPANDEDDDDEEDIIDSDDDPGWEPSQKSSSRPLAITSKTKLKFGLQNKAKSTKSKTLPKSSLTNRASAASTKSPKAASTNVGSKTDNNDKRPRLVITDNTPTGPEPKVGDFIVEKAECKNNNIPFLWQYKRGGLIQKFERIEENGKVLYKSALNFSDWWSCYAHKFQKVETQVMFKNRNVEKVAIIGDPVIEELNEQETTASGSNADSDSDDGKEESTKKRKESAQTAKMQEQEITSTTYESGPEEDFEVGQFVIDIKDRRNIDNFPIWKIESQILLKKYEAVIRGGKLIHKAVKTYRGYRDISKHYLPVKVNISIPSVANELVEVTEDTKPKITVTSSMEEEYEKNPLLRHFYVYMQVFLSQALEPGFLDEVRKTNDPTYMFPLGEIDKILEQKAVNIERKVKWIDKVKDALKKCPYLREVNKPDKKKVCEALVDSEDLVEESVFLFGSDYNKDTMKQSGSSHPCQEFKIGKTAVKYISTYHQLCHFRYNLYDKCLAKIKLIRDTRESGIEVEKIMDECLGNKSWVLQNFEDFMTLVEIT